MHGSGNGETHPHLSRVGDVPLGLEEFADVEGLSAPEVSVNAPVEGELQRLPVEAAAARSACVGAAQGVTAGKAYRTCVFELMAGGAGRGWWPQWRSLLRRGGV